MNKNKSKPKIMPGAMRFEISIGLTPASVAQIIVPPATGDIVRPSVLASVAKEPKSIMVMPNSGACGVTAPLKAKAAASPEPQSMASSEGPKQAAYLAISWLFFICSISDPVRPMHSIP